MSSFTDSKEREQSVDFVTYFSAGTLWAQKPARYRPENACGKKVAVQATTVQETDELPARSKKCTDEASRRSRSCRSTARTRPPTRRARSGRRDVGDSPVTLYAIKQTNGKLEQAGETFDSAPYGWPVAKGSPLAQSLLQALEHLIETGKYKEIAANWGLEEGMMTSR